LKTKYFNTDFNKRNFL